MRAFSSLAILLAAAAPLSAAPNESRLPPAPKLGAKPVSEVYHGTTVVDRFRFVEEQSPETVAWMRAQAARTRALFDSIGPRAAILKRMDALGGAFGAVRDVQYEGDRLFFLERAPGSEVANLIARDADGTRHVLIDIAAMIKASGGTPHAIDHFEPSRDGTKVAVGISQNGSEKSMLSVIDATSGATIAGPVFQGEFGSTSWATGDTGLFFNRMRDLPDTTPATERYLNSELAYWDLKSAPRVIVGAAQKLGPNSDPVRFPIMFTPRGTGQALLLVANGVVNEVEAWTAPESDAAAGTAAWRKIVTTEDAVTAINADSSGVYLLTHRDAPTFKVTTMPWSGTAATATTIVPAKPDQFIESIAKAKDALYVGGRERLTGTVWRVAGGRTEALAMPGTGTIGSIHATSNRDGVIYNLDGSALPLTTYEYRPTTRTSIDMKLETRPAIDLRRFATVTIDAVAKDGVRVPLSILMPAGPKKPRPFLLDAYGSYGVSNLPYFNARRLVLAENGGGSASCSVRGGGELGEAWRLGGKDANKPNTWRDAIACAETLIRGGYTTAAMLTITGTSAGGIMVGKAATERPDLFAGAISRVGDSNALRSETMAGGPANIPEFGTVTDPQKFRNLLAMDAYQSVKDGVRYPPFLLTTGLSDPRVAPWQAAKMTARLQEAGGTALLRIDEKAGHGIGTTRSTRDAEEADIAAFVFWRAGVPGWQPN